MILICLLVLFFEVMTLLVTLLFYKTFGAKKSNNLLFDPVDLKLKADVVCLKDGVLDTTLTDDPDCPDIYVSFYNKLPSDTKLDADLANFNEKCTKSICSETDCATLVNDASKAHDTAFKTSLKENCIPTGAENLDLDQCRKTDDKVITSLVDAKDCLDSYDALIELLPNSAAGKKFNQTLLAGEAEALKAFQTKCAKFICNKEDCYQAIIRTAITTYDSALKTTLQEKCKPPTVTAPTPDPAGGKGNNGYLSGTVSIFLLFISSFLASSIIY
jgi:hypothetical protein